MKKSLVILSAILVVMATNVSAQVIQIDNSTGCAVKFHIYSDASSGGGTITESGGWMLPTGTTTFGDIADLNDASCGGGASGVGWYPPTCYTSGAAGNTWDGVLTNIGLTPYYTGPTFTTNSQTTTTKDCMGMLVTIEWDNTTYAYPWVKIHY